MKSYIKMNNSDDNLSFGNLCRVIKECSSSKTFTSQSEIFSVVFDDDNLSDSTINNYCIGYRNIGSKYKKKFQKFKEEYVQNKLVLLDVINNLIKILESTIGYNYTYEEINSNKLLKCVCNRLYNIAKNDKNIDNEFTTKIYLYLEENKLYECISELLFYIILKHKQPIFRENIAKDAIYDILNKTNISLNDLEKFLVLNFKDGVNYTYELKHLAAENNAYACFELGYMEYKGEISGVPRYNVAYKYFITASNYNHPRANLLIADMFIKKQIGISGVDYHNQIIEYLNKAISLGSIAALNKLGIIYLNINKEKAIELFKKAADNDYVYAYNNLGKISEEEKDYKKAFEYYLKSASKEESWACNKIGEFYRQGLGCEKNLKTAFYYYNLATEVPIKLLDYYSKYNLAKYYYLNGNYEADVEKDESLAINLLEEASQNKIIEASIELFNIYLEKYLKNFQDEDLNKLKNYKKVIETNEKYNIEIKKQVEKNMQKIKKEQIDLTTLREFTKK